jgi:O-antigen ligase
VTSLLFPREHRLASLLLALVLITPWVFNPSWGPSPMVMQTCLAGAAALVWFVLPPAARGPAATLIATAWLVAACINGAIAVAQYFGLVTESTAWASAAAYGEAYGNLRQRNQLATLLALGLASAFFLVTVTRDRAVHIVLALAVVLVSAACALTSSRTGLLQWLLLTALLWVTTWRGAPKALRGWAVLSLASYALALLALPALATWWTGQPPTTLIDRMASDLGCVSRKVLWSNALHLIGLQPWTGWGLGEMDYAHHVTLYPGARFCLIVDNAHNLFLHAAVELGIPFAVGLALLLGTLVWKGAPWKERAPQRLLAWAALGVIMLHSQLEFPLWYGPFELAALLAISLLLQPRRSVEPSGAPGSVSAVPGMDAPTRPAGTPLVTRVSLGVLAAAALSYVVWDYHRVSQLFLAETERAAAYRTDTLSKVRSSWLFMSQVEFAQFTTTPVTPANAAPMAQLGETVLHYSPEPQVVERLLEAWWLLGRQDRVTWHLERFEAAFPAEFAAWKPPASATATPSSPGAN